MITSRADGHAHLWYHVPYCSIEMVLGVATKVSVYKHLVEVTLTLVAISNTFSMEQYGT